MTELKKMLKRMIITILVITISEFLVLSIFFKFESLWVFWGGLGSVVGLWMLAEDIGKFPSKEIKYIKNIPVGYLIRYFFYAMILAVASFVSINALFISFIGLMSLKIAPYTLIKIK